MEAVASVVRLVQGGSDIHFRRDGHIELPRTCGSEWEQWTYTYFFKKVGVTYGCCRGYGLPSLWYFFSEAMFDRGPDVTAARSYILCRGSSHRPYECLQQSGVCSRVLQAFSWRSNVCRLTHGSCCCSERMCPLVKEAGRRVKSMALSAVD